ncbi:CPBP family intramembrane metalloprotease [Neobacillus sp. MM2021_6]|uniref:CPBP family intramembrane glutamic endopeptidase n=1 Tax=Bacillaceae TaxID=186817 RepID=UPI001408F03F|nr:MULTISPECIES: CPBP family intramembrane glutamic endopeptidase [Bacillaceae]MBO0961657.1 CPBP family intramembrane metalloprotease [Neobacillus sp. MM2021_6]NHC20577.1 CPBP family intramembrane metalloprotease [Bacillus sp. MM2020_4]
MTTNLTQPISKRLLFAMLIVTIGAEIFLYCMRYSHMASTLYDAMMVSSFFIGLKLHQRLQGPNEQPKTKRQLTLQFTGAFLIFILGSTIINMYSTYTFHDFNTDYDQYVQDYSDIQMAAGENNVSTSDEPVLSFFEKGDTIGYDLYADTLAGLEEVWRLAYIILFLVMFKKIFPHSWERGGRDIFLMCALFLTSILFGIDHTLDSVEPWSVRIGAIVTFANMGLLFGLILLWTRNLWVTVIVHALYDITATLSWYYVDYAVELFALAVLIVHVTLFTMEKLQQRRLRHQEVVELVKAAE